RAGGGARMRTRRPFRHRAGGAEVRPCPGAAVRREGTRVPARGLPRRPGAGGRHAVHRAPRRRALEMRLVAVRGHPLPFAHRLDLGQRQPGLGWNRADRCAEGAAAGVRSMRPATTRRARIALAALGLAVAALLSLPSAAAEGVATAATATDGRIVFPTGVQQGAMVLGKVPPGSVVIHAGRTLRTTGYGTVVFGVGRDATGPLLVAVQRPDGSSEQVRIAVKARDWPLQRVNGVPRKTVDPPRAVAERIREEQALVAEARLRDDPRTDFARPFLRPVE